MQFDYIKMEINLTVEKARIACKLALDSGFRSIFLPQWLIEPCAEIFIGKETRLATIVGLPGGLSSTKAKYAEVKLAVKNGASEVAIPMNMKLLGDGKYDDAKLDFLCSAIPAEGSLCRVAALIEANTLSISTVERAINAAVLAGANEVKLSAITGGHAPDAETVSRLVKTFCFPISVLGGITGSGEDLISAGAAAIGKSNFAV
jgi:deoxyribose-phosphate aldolase